MDSSRYDRLLSLRESVDFLADRLDRLIQNRHTMLTDDEQYDRMVSAFCAVSFDFGKLYNSK